MIAHVSNAKVVAVSGGLTVEAAAVGSKRSCTRGSKCTDLEYEATFASHNRVQNGEVETVLCSVRKSIAL